MSTHYTPTAYLRIMKRKLPALNDPSGVHIIYALQQLWTSLFADDKDQWRDVPIVEDES